MARSRNAGQETAEAQAVSSSNQVGVFVTAGSQTACPLSPFTIIMREQVVNCNLCSPADEENAFPADRSTNPRIHGVMIPDKNSLPIVLTYYFTLPTLLFV